MTDLPSNIYERQNFRLSRSALDAEDFARGIGQRLARNAAASIDDQVLAILGYPSWEARLAYRIEHRSLRNRLRRLRRRIAYARSERRNRLSLAWAVLRGKHDCYDY